MPLLEPLCRLPFGLIDAHADFINAHRPGLEVFISSEALDSHGVTGLAARIQQSLSFIPALTLHAPFMDMSPGAVDSSVRQATHRRFSDVIGLAGLVRARCVVFHSGYEKWTYDHKIEPWLGNSLSFWPPLVRLASEAGTRLAIENIFEDEPGGLRLLMEGLDTSVAGICLDAGHFNLFSRLPLSAWMEAIGQYVIELHLHDNNGDKDAHMPPGDGTFDFRELFSLLQGREVIRTIEANSPEETLLAFERIRELSS